MKLLLSYGATANVVQEDGISPFHWACFGITKELADLLIAEGVDINSHTKRGRTALHNVVAVGQSGWDVLVEAGADLQAKEDNGYTPLHLAALVGRMEICGFLVKAGANINEKDNRGHTPLFYAGRFGHKSTYEYL